MDGCAIEMHDFSNSGEIKHSWRWTVDRVKILRNNIHGFSAGKEIGWGTISILKLVLSNLSLNNYLMQTTTWYFSSDFM